MDKNYVWSYSFPMKKGDKDNDYYFYEDGRILHFYDINQNKYNIEEYVKASDISNKEKEIMTEACPEEFRELILKCLNS